MAVVAGRKQINQSASADEAAAELDAFELAWAKKYRSVIRMRCYNWGNITPFIQFLPEVRKVIYTTNAIESPNMSLRKLTRNRRIFPNDDSVLKLQFLAVREAPKSEWLTGQCLRSWRAVVPSAAQICRRNKHGFGVRLCAHCRPWRCIA